MSNKNNNFFKKNASSIIICSSIAVLLLATLYFSFNSLVEDDNTSDENFVAENTVNENNLFEAVNKSNVKSYKESEDTTEDIENNSTTENKTNENNETNDTTQNTETSNTENKTDENKTDESKETADSTTFSLFDDTKEMIWPVSGQIVMDYSTETAIYDKTLDQYRTNDSISISATEGTEVLAAAEGVVERIFSDVEDGKTIVINHGNGWASTYSQLQDNVLVDVGQVVNEGQIIGAVGTPSSYTSLLGSHLDFKITKDNVTTDPKVVLAQIEE